MLAVTMQKPEQESLMERKLISHWSTVLLTLLCGFMPAVLSAADDEPGAWLIASTTDGFSNDAGESRWRYWVDAQIRVSDAGVGVNQYLLRPAIGFQLDKSFQAWFGYARLETDRRRGSSVHENRYWQQLNWKAGQWKGGAMTVRARLQQRSLSTGDDLGLVLRLMLKYVRPLDGPGSRYFAASVEPFVNLRDTDWGADKGLGQNRVVLAVGQRIGGNAVLELGYMNQYIPRENAVDRSNHLALIAVKLNF